MATIIKTNGDRAEITLETDDRQQLAQLQAAVGGFIQIIELTRTQQLLIVNEEGLIDDLPINPTATELAYGYALMAQGGIRGNVVLCARAELPDDEEETE